VHAVNQHSRWPAADIRILPTPAQITLDVFVLCVISHRFLSKSIMLMHLLHVKMLSTGTPAQTGTGTLIVHLMDVNDNFPEFATNYQPVVYENRPPGHTVVEIIAEDRDTRSNGPPFEFWLPCGGGCPCPGNPSCADFSFKFVPGMNCFYKYHTLYE